MRAVRGVADVPLQVDVNEAWSLDEALEALPQLAELGVEYCEQPLPAGDPGGAELKRRSPLPIYVDEDCHTLADVAACAERAHGINVKLAKSGGIREAVRMVHAARALGLGCMLGCMVESGLGIAAGARSRASSTTSTSTATSSSRTTRGRASRSSTACSFRPRAGPRCPSPGADVERKRYLLLAEGFSGDPHYGKTMRGVLRYGADDVVAILDSTRAGET